MFITVCNIVILLISGLYHREINISNGFLEGRGCQIRNVNEQMMSPAKSKAVKGIKGFITFGNIRIHCQDIWLMSFDPTRSRRRRQDICINVAILMEARQEGKP